MDYAHPTMSRILIVEDEPDLAATLEYSLGRAGFQTVTARTGGAALVRARESPHPDLVLLDLNLPDISGTEVCRRLREEPSTRDIPVIMATARSQETDRVVGFEVGADDYVIKPYSVRELALRIRAVLRRSHPDGDRPGEVMVFGHLRVDEAGHRIWVDDEEVVLTALEFRLLGVLLARRGRVQSRQVLLEDVWGIVADVTTRTVDTHIKRLRQKLGRAGSYIETLRGVGYRIRSRPAEAGG